jgi:hypothetical protein
MALTTKYGTVLGHRLVKSTAKKDEHHCTYCGRKFSSEDVASLHTPNSWNVKELTCKAK